MAKAKTGGRGGSRGTSKSAGSRRGVGKGDLEVGNARRDAGAAAGPMRRTAAKRPTKSGLQLPGEKAVRATERTVPVEPPRRGRT